MQDRESQKGNKVRKGLGWEELEKHWILGMKSKAITQVLGLTAFWALAS